MVGQVSLGGLTLEQAQSRLTERIARFLRSPAVTVELARFSILVTGAVRSPGQYEMDNGSLVMEAITRRFRLSPGTRAGGGSGLGGG